MSWAIGRRQIKPGGKQHKQAIQAIAMKIAGADQTTIAKALNTTPGTVATILYRAGKAGLIDYGTAKEELEGKLWPKALQNMDAFLEDKDNPDRQERATFKTLDSMTKALYADKGGDPAQMVTMIGIKIEPVANASPVRAEMIGGVPAYAEGEIE